MNIKKLEKKLKDLDIWGNDEREMIKIFRQAITQVVESVPVEDKWEDLKPEQRTQYDLGVHHVWQEIKQWKKKILKELKGGEK